MLTADDLRIRLDEPADDWTPDDVMRAESVLASARTVIVTLAGPEQVAEAEAGPNEPKLAALDEATMAYAVPLFRNPERRLQARQGAEYSTSWADSVRAASGIDEARTILTAAGFGATSGGAFTVDTAPNAGYQVPSW